MKTEFLGPILKKAREDAGLTQKQLADELGYSAAQFISNWERGVSSPPIEAWPVLTKTLGLTTTKVLEALQRELATHAQNELREVRRAIRG
jgi:transcriptional regulator with XRE-family HTH domain